MRKASATAVPNFKTISSVMGSKGRRSARRALYSAARSTTVEPLESRTLFAATWTALTNAAPSGGIEAMTLLSNGDVLGQLNGSAGWALLTPSSTGSYINGTWSRLSNAPDTRTYYSTQTLENGNVFMAGGEYGTGGSNAVVYNPVTNTWTPVPSSVGDFGDAISEMLGNGEVLDVPIYPATSDYSYIYNPATNSWSTGPKLYRGSDADEQNWVKLADGSFLMPDGKYTTERYVPSTNTFVNDATDAIAQTDSLGEFGTGVLLPNGKAFYVGTGSTTEIYTPSTYNSTTGIYSPTGTAMGSWSAGPTLPSTLGQDDAPMAVLPDGNVLISVGPIDSYSGGTTFYIYNYQTNTLALSSGAPTLTDPPYVNRMLDLPDGTTLMSVDGTKLYDYNDAGTTLTAPTPTISSIAHNSDGSYTVTGTQFNGNSEGAYYGDDAQMNSNYPIVRLTSSAGTVYFARSYNWSSTGVDTGTATETTNFTLPLGLPAGTYTANVMVNGFISAGSTITTPATTDAAPTIATAASASPSPTTGLTTALSVLGASGNGESTLTYDWINTSAPSGDSTASVSINGTNAAKNTTATFQQAGTYAFTVTITDALGLSVTSSVTVVVNQALTSVSVTPTPVNLTAGQTQQLTATAYDQFGNAMSTQPGFTWALASGAGTVSSTGLYTTPATGTLASVTASTGSFTAADTIYVVSAPWISTDVGSPSIAGSAYDTNGTFTVTGSGADTWGTSDEFHYVYQSIGGNGSISAEVVTQTDSEYYAKAGVMIRATTDTASIDAWMAITPQEGAQFGARTTAGGSTAGPTKAGPVAPYYVKLVRSGTTISGYYSANGTTWTLASSATINVTGAMDIGLFDCAVTNSTLCTVTFSHVNLLVAAPYTLSVSAGASGTLNVLTGDTGPSGSTLTVTGVTQGAKGTVVNNGDGTVTYTANASANGPDTFIYTISDGLGDTATGTVTVSILGLQAYYRFNEGTGTTTADSSGDGYTATVTATTWGTGVDGTDGLTFNGSSYVTPPVMNLNTNTVTLSGWVYQAGTQVASTGIIFERDSGGGNGLDFYNATGTLGYTWGANAGTYNFNSKLVVPANTWTFVALVITASNATIYMQPLGGTLSSKTNTLANPVEPFSSPIYIGQDTNSTTRRFVGSMDEVRIYNIALSASGIAGIANLAPTVATPAAGSPSPVTGTTSALSVLGADYAGQSVLTYTWSATTVPTGANTPIFSLNATNAAQNTTATFYKAGTYVLKVTIADAGGLSTTSSVTVVVNQTLTGISVTPASVNLNENATQTFTAVAYDQFTNALTTQPTFDWTKSAGVGSINASTGVYTAPNSSGSATILASSGGISGSASVAVAHTGPTVVNAAAASPSPAVGTSVALSVLGADEDGESSLTYLWAATSIPAGATVNFTVNNTNAAKNTSASFNKSGSYTFQVTLTDDQGAYVTSSVTVTVNQTLTSLTIAATNATVAGGSTAQLTGDDQFGNAISGSSITWNTSGGGTINTNGLFTANQSGGSYTISGTIGSTTVTTGVTVVPTAYTGVAGGETFAIRLSPADSSIEQVFVNTPETSAPTYSIGLALLPSLSFASSGSDGGLTIDFTNGNPLPAAGVSDTGGGGVFVSGVSTGGMNFNISSGRITDTAAPSSAIAYSDVQTIEFDLLGGSNTLTQIAQPGAPLTYNAGAGSNTLNVNAGTFTLSSDPALTSGNLTINDESAIVFSAAPSTTGYNARNLTALNLGDSAAATLLDSGTTTDRLVLETGALSIASTATLDLGNNDLIVHNGNLASISSLLQSGENDGTTRWTGTGIASSAAAADSTHLTALGEMSNNYSGSAIYSTFDGQTAVAGDVLVKYTYLGDANLDGQVDGSDYTKIDNGFNNHLTGWSNGDFNYDNAIDGSDYTLIDNAYNTQSAPIASSGSSGSGAPTSPPTSPQITPGLVAYFKFNGITAGTTADSSGNDYTAAVHGATSAIGVDATAGLAFNGTSDYVSVPPVDLNSNTVTLSGWIQRDGTQTDGAGLILNGSYGLKLGSGNQLTYSCGSSTDNSTGLVVPDQQWTFVAVTISPTQATLYMQPLGGAMQSVTQSVTLAAHAFSSATNLGADVAGGKYFDGSMDEVRIYENTLDADDIAAIANLAPTITTPASANQSPDVPLTINLLVQAISQAGASNLTYTWAVTSGPAGATASYLVNGTETSNSTTATVSEPGTYTFQVTVTDPGHLSATSSVSLQFDGYPADIGDVYYDAPVDGSGIVPLNLGNVLLDTRVPVLIYTAPNPADRWVVIADSLTLTDPNAQLDLGGNDLIVHDSGSLTPQQLLAQVTGYVQSGFDLGSGYPWQGPGLASAAAAADSTGLSALGVMLNMNAKGNAIYSTFDGQPVTASDVLVKYTRVGDANLDGLVDGSDYSLIDNGFANHLTGWANGDFNYDGVVNAADYKLIDSAFSTSPTSLVASPAAQIASTVFHAPTEPAAIGAIASTLHQKLGSQSSDPGQIIVINPGHTRASGASVPFSSNPFGFPSDEVLRSVLSQTTKFE